MHERFSDRARHAMALANQEANRLRHEYLAPAHIMLGLIAEGNCVATEALRVLRVDLDRVRTQVAEELGEGSSGGGVGLRAQSDATKQVIALAVEEARKLGHRYVGTEHLVLALLAYEQGIPSQVLRKEGVDADQLRERILAMLRSSTDPNHDLAHSRHGDFEWVHQQELAKAFHSPKFWHTLILAVDSANRLGAGEIQAEHLLLAILRDETCRASSLLHEHGVTADVIRAKLMSRT